jgi:sugar phosphate isomerase/epimerase
MRTAAQLYTFRDLDLSLPTIVELAARAGYDGVELAFRAATADPERLGTALTETELGTPAAHVTLDALEGDVEATIERYRTLGCDRLVTYTLDGSHFESREATDAFADRLRAVADRLGDAGVEFCYHNHDVEFADLGGQTAFDRLTDRLDGIAWEVDAGWVAAAGRDPTAVIGGLDDVPIVHAKDMYVERATPAEIGRGDVDLVAVAAAAAEAGAGWLVYEHDFADHPLVSMDHGADALADLVASGADR